MNTVIPRKNAGRLFKILRSGGGPFKGPFILNLSQNLEKLLKHLVVYTIFPPKTMLLVNENHKYVNINISVYSGGRLLSIFCSKRGVYSGGGECSIKGAFFQGITVI